MLAVNIELIEIFNPCLLKAACNFIDDKESPPFLTKLELRSKWDSGMSSTAESSDRIISAQPGRAILECMMLFSQSVEVKDVILEISW